MSLKEFSFDVILTLTEITNHYVTEGIEFSHSFPHNQFVPEIRRNLVSRTYFSTVVGQKFIVTLMVALCIMSRLSANPVHIFTRDCKAFTEEANNAVCSA